MTKALVTNDSTSLQFSAHAIRKAFKEANPLASAREAKAHVTAVLRQAHAFTPAHINEKLRQGWTWQGVKSNAKDTRVQYTLVAPPAPGKESELSKARAELEKLRAEVEALRAGRAQVAPATVTIPAESVTIVG